MNPQDEHAAEDLVLELEFLGGPLDGLNQPLQLPLPTRVCYKSDVPLKRTPWLYTLAQMLSRDYSPPFRVAIYELELNQEQLYYRHVGSRVATAYKAETGRLWLMADTASQEQE